jgi:hypothetical protein
VREHLRLIAHQLGAVRHEHVVAQLNQGAGVVGTDVAGGDEGVVAETRAVDAEDDVVGEVA